MTETPPILALIGSTGSGKSALAMELARRRGAEILSADSMQVYRGMDIGTAKPTAEEQRQIRHHVIDVVGPDEPFSVARFVSLADVVIADAASRNVPLIVVGGTPLYYKALFEGLFEGPSADESVRGRLRDLDDAELRRRILAADPAAAARIDARDRRRMMRALEVHELTGRPISELQRQWRADHPGRYPAQWVGLRWDRDALNRRINQRVRQMLEAGWVAETAELSRKYPILSHTAAEATGYAQIIDHLVGRVSIEDAAEEIKIATRQLARRQMKWFRGFPKVKWIEGNLPLEAGQSHLSQ